VNKASKWSSNKVKFTQFLVCVRGCIQAGVRKSIMP
jgi:hypothetical protein